MGFVFNFVHPGGLALLALYFQIGRGYSAGTTGLLVGIQGLGSLAALMGASRLTKRFGPRWLVTSELALSAAATVTFVLAANSNTYIVVAALFLRGLGLSSIMTPSYAEAYAAVPREEIARATTTLNVIPRFGGAAGVASLLAIYERTHTEDLSAAFTPAFLVAVGVTALAVAPALACPRRAPVKARR